MSFRPIAFGCLSAALLSALLGSCRGASSEGLHADAPALDELAPVHAALDALYAAFCFQPAGEPDWGGMRALFAEGAVFVSPSAADVTPQGVDASTFLADFQAWVRSPAMQASGFHERITHVRVDRFGGIAHAYVAFDGFEPGGGGQRTRGLDSLQLVRDGERWLVVSFTTQYAGPSLSLPARFERPTDAR